MVGDPVEKSYFNVDEYTGLIRTIGGFNQLMNNSVFGFDIRATDRGGASDGRSAITNVFVSLKLPKLLCIMNNFNLFLKFYRFTY